MKLKYNHNGETNKIPLSTDTPQGKRLAVRHDNQTYYAPLVPTTDSAASDIHLVFGGDTLALSTGTADMPVEIVESFNFSDNTNPAQSNAVTVLGNYGDFGVIADTSQPEGYNATLTKGTEYYSRLSSITAAKPNSTIIGNANNNIIRLYGGDKNFVANGIDRGYGSIIFEKGGGVIVDYGYSPTISGASLQAATITTQTATPTNYAYDRKDTGSYRHTQKKLVINGTVTSIYFDKNTDGSKNQRIPTADFVIVYSDENQDDNVILLKDVLKSISRRNRYEADTRAWENSTNTVYKDHIPIYTGNVSITGPELSNFSRDWADVPASLQPAIIALYNIYNNSGYTNSRKNDGLYTQILPDWIPQ